MLVVSTKKEIFPNVVFLSFLDPTVFEPSQLNMSSVMCDVRSTQEHSLCFCLKGLKLAHPSGLPDGGETQPRSQDGLGCWG